MRKLAIWKTKQFIELNGKEIIDIPTIDWQLFKLTGSQVYIANAFYNPTSNSIYIPVAYMQKPFVDLNKSHMYNLAFIGDTLAHEMSHSLDAMGSRFDYEGNLHNWWSQEDYKKYQVIINDIIKQYEVFAGYDGVTFDASIGIGEDMADISAVAILEEYLRDLLMYSDEVIPIASLYFQAFFIYFAVQNRQHVYKNAVKAQLKTNPHPMDKYRTNVPLSRLELFRSLYNVKKGDNMWWHSTSTIW
jgi:putative endopeptidase